MNRTSSDPTLIAPTLADDIASLVALPQADRLSLLRGLEGPPAPAARVRRARVYVRVTRVHQD